MREPLERLRDIHEAIARIEKYTKLGRTSFDQDELVQTWVIHNLEIIGEAARCVGYMGHPFANPPFAPAQFPSPLTLSLGIHGTAQKIENSAFHLR